MSEGVAQFGPFLKGRVPTGTFSDTKRPERPWTRIHVDHVRTLSVVKKKLFVISSQVRNTQEKVNHCQGSK